MKHTKDGRRYLYAPMITERKAKRTALKGLLHTFFQGKPQNLVAALLDPSDQNLSREENQRNPQAGRIAESCSFLRSSFPC